HRGAGVGLRPGRDGVDLGCGHADLVQVVAGDDESAEQGARAGDLPVAEPAGVLTRHLHVSGVGGAVEVVFDVDGGRVPVGASGVGVLAAVGGLGGAPALGR